MNWKNIGLLIVLFVSLNSKASEIKALTQVAKSIAPHEKNISQIAKDVYQYSKKHSIDPYLMLALIKVESDFNQKAISNTGDYSLAQINYKVWKEEFNKKGIKLNFYKLKNNPQYALDHMALILKILKQRYSKKDPHWYARYHSNTKKHKKNYLKKVNKQLALIKKLKSLPKPNRLIAKD
jgi:hypothetical protein